MERVKRYCIYQEQIPILIYINFFIVYYTRYFFFKPLPYIIYVRLILFTLITSKFKIFLKKGTFKLLINTIYNYFFKPLMLKGLLLF